MEETKQNEARGGSGRGTTPDRLTVWAYSWPIYVRPNHVTV